jgi:hypothetical protein
VSQQPVTSNRSTVREFQARTLKPITAYPINGEGKARVIPGGALVTVHDNVTQGVLTATAHMGGEWYEAIVDPAQFTPYNQTNQ